MEVLLLNEVKNEIVNKIENEKNIILICFDPKNECNINTDDFKLRLHQIHDSVVFHTELESCITFIQSIKQKQIFLIISESSASQILSHTTIFHQIKSIFIFCPRNVQYEHLSVEDPKIIGIYDTLDLLYTSIKEQLDLSEKQIPQWCFFDQVEYATKDLSKQTNNFLWLQLFHTVLLHLSSDQQIKRQKMDAGNHYYQRIVIIPTLIDKFEYEYQPHEAIHLFMKHSFLQKTINKALQTEDMDQLYTLRYFLSDLIQNLRHRHQQIVQFDKENLTVYRQMKLSNDQFKQLQENKGKLISMKGFLTATTERSSSALFVSTSSREQTNLISVLFEIECNSKELNDNFIFADITQLTCQQTILFDLNTTFRLETIQQDEQMWVIKLNAVNDGEIIIQKYIHDTRRQIEDLSVPIILGKLICEMNQWNQSQKYFEQLLNDSHDEDLAWIEYFIGQAHQWKGEWNAARTYYDRSYQRMIHNEPSRIIDSALVLSNIGEILCLQGKYEEAFDFHQRALIIRKKYYSSHHTYIASSLENIGLVLQKRLKDEEAFVFFQQGLIIREKYYNSSHVDIAISLSNIASTLTRQKKHDEALIYYQRALSIYKKYYPSDHVHIASTLNNIGDILYRQNKEDEGLPLIQQALAMQKKFYPFGHINIASALFNIGNIKYDQGDYDESLELHHQALTMLTKFYSSDHHIILTFILNSIGDTHLQVKENCDKALHFHQQALTILETYYPSYLAHIAITLNYIANVYSKQKKNDEALDLYYRALKMHEEYYLSDHIEIVSVLGNIGNTLENAEIVDEIVKRHEQALIVQKKNGGAAGNVSIASSLNGIGIILQRQDKYDEALDFYQRSLMIREEFDPSNHVYIASNLSDISTVLFDQKKYEEAFDYSQRTLNIRKAHHPSNNVGIIQSLNQMGNARFHQERYDEAYDFFQQALTIYEKYSLSGHEDIVFSITRIGRIKYNERKFDEALNYYHRAVNILKEFHPTDYDQMIYGLEWIGFIWLHKQSHDRAIEYYEKCLRIIEAGFSSGHSSIVELLSKLGQIQRSRRQYEHSLSYELKCFLIREKVLPPDHQDIGKSLTNIGVCYEHLDQRKLALDYYKRALAVHEQCLSSEHQDGSVLKLKIEKLSGELR